MRTKRRSALVTLVLVAALAATGCAPEGPVADDTPTPTSTPLFASDEEALAAAKEAYAAYLAMTDQIFADGGKDPERLLDVATQQIFDAQVEGYKTAADNGWTGTGQTKLDSVSLQEYDANRVTAAVRIYGCVDLSEVDVVDATGATVVSPSRPDRSPTEISFDVDGKTNARLIVSGERPWSGDNFCD
ncbi:hypothetical protein [Conyzicola sp.]|uniref:hypothetical protein n=1 Tax=Conyzicola sp. TaxID=1969404 RepID=UPI003988B021